MHRSRVSSGLNWNPHLMLVAGFVEVSRDDVEPFDGCTSVYPISVGTLSEVMPDRRKYSTLSFVDVYIAYHCHRAKS